jgi:spermidine synthase
MRALLPLFLLAASSAALGLATPGASRAATLCPPEGPRSLLVRFVADSGSGSGAGAGRVFVVDGPRCRYLRFGSPFGIDQSVASLADPEAVPTEYVRIAALGLAVPRRIERVATIGLGGGAFPRLVLRAAPDAELDSVEVDPAVVEAAARFFGVAAGPRHRVHVADAAEFLARDGLDGDGPRFDLLFLDTYDADGLPERLATGSYFASAAARLRPGGVLVANLGVGDPVEYVTLARRLRAAAGDTRCLSAREEANLVVFAAAPETLADPTFAERVARLDATRRLPFRLADLAPRLRPCL